MNQDTTSFRLRPPAVGSRQDVRTIARSAVYYAPKAAMIFFAIFAIGIAIALLLPARYRSEARLLTLPGDYYAVRGQDRGANDAAEAFKPEELANVEMQLLSSEDLQRTVLTRLGTAANGSADLEKARKAFAKNLTIQRVDGANVIELRYTDASPDEAAKRLNMLLNVYFASRAQVLASGRSTLIAQRRDAAEKEFNAADTALRSFQERNGIVDIEGQVNGAIAVDTALRQSITATRAELSQAQGSVSKLRRSSGSVPRTVELYRDDSEATKAIADMQSQILTLEAKRADLQGRYMADSPLIQQVDKQIDGLRIAISRESGKLKQARRVGRNNYYDAANDRILENDAAASGEAAKLSSLGQELADSQMRLRNLNEISAIIARQKTQRDLAEERFRSLSKQWEDARAHELEATTGNTNVRVIQRPSIPDGRSNGLIPMMAGAIAAALAVAGAALFILIARRDTYLDPEEVRQGLGVPLTIDLTQSGAEDGHKLLRLPAFHDRSAGEEQRGRIVALVTADTAPYGRELGKLLQLLETQAPGPVATVSFEEAAYHLPDGSLAKLMPPRNAQGRIKVGSLAWTIDHTGERLLASLRGNYARTILLVPPVAAGTIEEARDTRAIHAAALADDILLVVQTEVTKRAASETIVGALRDYNVQVRAAVVTGRKLKWPKFIRALG
jgi:uncharacterized protein involved in exopolysaccharide biosynthesis